MDRAGGQVEVTDLWVSYGSPFRRERVLRGVELRAAPGEVTAVIGRNGVGKTTLFRALLGFLSPDHGHVAIDHQPPGRYRATRGLGYLPEALTFPAAWTVRDVLGRGADLAVAASDRRSAFARAVERAGFDGAMLSKRASRCSKGVQRRLALAFALIGEPKVLFLDEPFSGLDPPSRLSLRREIGETMEAGATVLLASHDLDEVGRLATQVYRLEGGKASEQETDRGAGGSRRADLEAGFRRGEP